MLTTYLLVISVLACCIAVPATVLFYNKARRLEVVALAEKDLADNVITMLVSDSAEITHALVARTEDWHYQLNKNRLLTAQVNDLSAELNRERRVNTAHLTSLELLATEVARLEGVQEEDRIAYVREVLGNKAT